MDTSKEYIKQCEKAEEIQETHTNLWIGDIAVTIITKNLFGINGYIINCDDRDIRRISYRLAHSPNWWLRGELLWLPRQDQLQEILSTSQFFESLDHLCIQFNNFCSWFEESPNRQFSSMEQLWLVFVMKEKYNKVWNGKECKWKTKS